MNIIESNLQFNGLSWGNNPRMLILHHAEASTCSIQDIHQWHLNNGWTGCDYHFLVRNDGSIYRGRPEEAIGSHCHGVNATSLGICAEGDYTKESMPETQKNAIFELCKYLCSKYGTSSIKGHKELYVTECPGQNYPLQSIKELITTGGTVTATSNTGVLELWDSGSAIKDLQAKLIKLGYNITADGIYGPNTYNAVKHFQASIKLTPDSIAGPQTMLSLDMSIANKDAIDIHSVKYLQHAIGAAEDNILGPATLSKCPVIKIGCNNSNTVKWVQAKLNITADGIFGNGTKVAVQNFQASHGLDADGIVGQNTWKKLLGL